jgi:hypothetical protein
MDLVNARSEFLLSFKYMYGNNNVPAHISVVGRDEVTDDDVCNGALYQHKLISVTAAQGQ